MIPVVVVLCFVATVLAQTDQRTGGPQCGPPPTKHPNECCEGLDKFVKEELYTKCDTECKKPDMCCKGNCIAGKLGFLKNNKFDKDSAIKSLSTAFGSDSGWSAVYTKAVDNCMSKVSSMKDKVTSRPGEPQCETIENGIITYCIKKDLIFNCPKPVKDVECEKFKTFMDCVMPKA